MIFFAIGVSNGIYMKGSLNNLKRFFVFSLSFIILYFVMQVLTGFIVTLLYVPNIAKAWNTDGALFQTITLQGKSFPISIIFVLISVAIAYFIQRKFVRLLHNKRA